MEATIVRVVLLKHTISFIFLRSIILALRGGADKDYRGQDKAPIVIEALIAELTTSTFRDNNLQHSHGR